MPQVLARHRQDQAGLPDVRGGDLVAAVRGDVKPVAGHHRGGQGIGWHAVAQHSAGADGRAGTWRRKAPGQQGLRHR
jgi:hypothetical protein